MIDAEKFYKSKVYRPQTLEIDQRSYQANYVYESEVIDLVRRIERAAENRDLILSRWQTNGPGFVDKITYALHTGNRASQFRFLPDETVICSIVLTSAEGTTRRCKAYKDLEKMAEQAGLFDSEETEGISDCKDMLTDTN